MIPEKGTGLANADAYVSVEFADEYFSARGNQTWAGLGSADKEAAIIKATDYLEAVYFDKWQGERLKGFLAILKCTRCKRSIFAFV